MIWATEVPQKNSSLHHVLFWQISANICICVLISFFWCSFEGKSFKISCESRKCFKWSAILVLKLNQVDLLFWCSNVAYENCEKFCMEEVFKCRERRMIWEDEGWTKLKLGMPMSPQDISKKYKREILGMPKASPSSSTKILGHLSRHYIFIASYDMCYSWSVSYVCFQFCMALFAVVYGWILPYLFGDIHALFSLSRTL